MIKRLRAGGRGDGVVYKSPWSQLHEYPKYASVVFCGPFLISLWYFLGSLDDPCRGRFRCTQEIAFGETISTNTRIE